MAHKKHTDQSGLTPTDREILALAATGMTDNDIALALGMAWRTVQYHYQSMRDRLELDCSCPKIALVAHYVRCYENVPTAGINSDSVDLVRLYGGEEH